MKALLCCVSIAIILWLPFQASAAVVDYYDYKHDEIYQVRAALGITTQIELSPDEKFWTTAPASVMAGSSTDGIMFFISSRKTSTSTPT